MRRRLLVGGALVVIAGAVAAVLVVSQSGEKGREGFAGDRAANLGYALWLSPDRETLFLERRPYRGTANGGLVTNPPPLAWRIPFRASLADANVVAPAFRGEPPYELPLLWSEVDFALRTGRPTPKPAWAKRHVG